MTSANKYAQQVLEAIEQSTKVYSPVELDEKRQNNAAKVMEGVLCHRLESSGPAVEHIKYTRYRWSDGIVSIRNCRVGDHHWTVIGEKTLKDLAEASSENPVVHLLSFYPSEEKKLHVWAIPEELVRDSLWSLSPGQKGDRTVEVFIDAQRIHKSQDSPDLSPFYRSVELHDLECESLAEAIKLDFAAKEQKSLGTKTSDDPDVEESEDITAGVAYTSSTLDFIIELPNRTDDSEWHAENKKRYENVLRNPTRDFVEQLRDQYIEDLSPEVAAGKRHLSILKKNDYGQGGYHDHYWFAFYDPDVGTKIRSCQLFFRLLGNEQLWRYGFSMGNYCEDYTERLQNAIKQNISAVSAFLATAPADTIVRVSFADAQKDYTSAEFSQAIAEPVSASPHPLDSQSNTISVIREFPLNDLLSHAEGLVDEVGKFFQWVWPFFQASTTGSWLVSDNVLKPKLGIDEDEDAPKTIAELSTATALPTTLLQDIEDAILTKQQIILVGPPGTSKTYIADWFARYFARQRDGQSQGKTDTLYMHANWSYEDFFMGIKPFTKDGQLKFEPKKGFFLEWVDSLTECDSSARHVLVIDEINRCDTAAVLGELLQLLEYRGQRVQLLSGTKFIFPKNLYIIGTMNSADRSIGRMDLALRRRFLWLELHPRYDVLKSWLSRKGNNPVGFSAGSLKRCNQILEELGIPPEQQVGHALFMVQTPGSETIAPEDRPLRRELLDRIVRFSVRPYLNELFLMQFGRVDQRKISEIEAILLSAIQPVSQESESLSAESNDGD